MAAALPPWPVCYNYHPECEAAITNQAKLQLHASYVYKSMACYFDRGDVALKHFSLFFLQQSKKEVDHADYLLAMQKEKREGNPRLCDIPGPEDENWESGLKVMECALRLAKRVRQSLLSVHQVITERHGRIFYFLPCDYLQEQEMFIQELEEHITDLSKLGAPEDSLAESLDDKLTLGDSKD